MGSRFDFVVVGAGSGGVRAARIAAGLGAKVAIVESGLFGGTCVHAGCVPKKLLAYGAAYGASLEDARRFGWDVEAHGHSWTVLRDAKDAETSRLGGVYRSLLDGAGVEVVVGHATIDSPTSVRVGERVLEAPEILVATGSAASRLRVPGGELGITSDEAFHLPELPRSIAILGAGYIALEFASIFRGLGVDVTVVHRGPEVLTRFDHDVQRHVRAELEKRGIHFRLGTEVRSIARTASGLVVHTSGDPIEAGDVMHCVGRRARTASLELDRVGVRVREDASIPVDAAFRSSVPSIRAVGDVTGHVQLTPVALAEGMWVARHLFADAKPAPIDYRYVPTAVFCEPNVATVGLTEETARAGHEVTIYRTAFRPMRHTVSGRDERMLMKLVVDRASDRVLGVHVVGPDAGEIVQGFAVALTCGATKADLDRTIGIHPTAAEELVTLRTPV